MDGYDQLKIFTGIVGVLAFLVLSVLALIFLAWHRLDVSFRGAPKVDGPVAWREEAEVHLATVEEHKHISAVWGLERRYETVTLYDDSRELLLEKMDFDTVEARLDARFAAIAGPLDFRLFSASREKIAGLSYGDDPAALQSVFDAWVAHNPRSSHARVIRGRFLTDLAWYHRGTGLGETVTRASGKQFVAFLKKARSDLEEARELNPADPDPAAGLITVAKGLGLKRAVMEEYYQAALAANPLDLGARIGKFGYLLPKWYGTWPDVDAFVAECDADRYRFPLLGVIRRMADEEMRTRGDSFEASYHAAHTRAGWADVYVDQLAQTPGHLFLMANVAYYAFEGGDYARAVDYFDRVGDRFPRESKFEDVVEYSKTRAAAYGQYGLAIPGADGALTWTERAVDVAPHSGYAHYAHGIALARRGQLEQAERFFHTATKLDPGHCASYLSLAQVAEHTHRRQEAANYARKALELEPNDAERWSAREILNRNR